MERVPNRKHELPNSTAQYKKQTSLVARERLRGMVNESRKSKIINTPQNSPMLCNSTIDQKFNVDHKTAGSYFPNSLNCNLLHQHALLRQQCPVENYHTFVLYILLKG